MPRNCQEIGKNRGLGSECNSVLFLFYAPLMRGSQGGRKAAAELSSLLDFLLEFDYIRIGIRITVKVIKIDNNMTKKSY